MTTRTILLHLSLVAATLAPAPSAYAQPGSGPTNVVVAEAITHEVADVKVFVGSIKPSRTSVVGSSVDGRVMTMPVEEGDSVKGGETLAQLRTRTIEAELAAARAQLELRRQELGELKRGSRPEEIEQANARMLANKARFANAKRNLERVRRVYESRSASDDELDNVESIAIETEQDFLEAQAFYKQVVAGPRVEQIAQAEARVAVEQQAVQRLEDIVKTYTIVAPFDGFVTAKRTEVGEWVTPGQTIVEVIDLTTVDVEIRVLEDYVSQLSVGDPASIALPSHPDRVLTGKIHRIVPLAGSRSRSFPVRVRVTNEIGEQVPLLMAGMFAEVTLGIGAPVTRTLVPKDAIVLGGLAPVVYRVELDEGSANTGTVREVRVSVGVAVSELIAVRGMIEPKALVVVRGNERLRPGQNVTITGRIDANKLLYPTARMK